jgi:cobalamin-dependent methionine synthase I
MISVSIQKIKPDMEKLKRKFHVKTAREEQILGKVHERIRQALDPKYSYRKVSFTTQPMDALIAGSKELASFLMGTKEGFVVICTVGSEPCRVIQEYQKGGDMISALYADRTASDAVENLAEHIEFELVNKFFDLDKVVFTKRYSPGYGDLPLEKQKDLFALFPPIELDVTLTPDNYMHPEKSISYIVGVLSKR